jgi:fructose-bisphosphate aldolase class 1
MPSYMFYRNRRTPFNFGYPEVKQKGLPAFFSRLKEDYNEAKERLAQDAAKKQTWQYQHAKMSASGEKSIALLATGTIKLVFHDMVRLQKLAEQKGVVPISSPLTPISNLYGRHTTSGSSS